MKKSASRHGAQDFDGPPRLITIVLISSQAMGEQRRPRVPATHGVICSGIFGTKVRDLEW